MNRARLGLFFASAVGLMTATAPASADNLLDSFTGRCDYRCCDQNNNCSVHNFYMGGKSWKWANSCTWEDVCSHQGTIGWSYGGTPSKANSRLTYTKGCWQLWEKFYPFSSYSKKC
jgi:hypothetical protein